MSKRTYIETTCKSAVNRVNGMPFKWSLNPYRGCTHACHYCYARATHTYFEMNADEDFETKIIVKTNVADVLRREVARPTWTGESIAIGTATDPYQPCEGKYRLTRRAVEALLDYRNPFTIVTKSTLVVRDLDLLVEAAQRADVAVYFTVTTVDEAIWRSVEPGTPPPKKRLEILQRLVEAGVPAGVYMAPVLPGITDSADSIAAVAAAAKEHGARSFWASPLRLAPLVKEHYLGFVGDAFPDLLHRYERAYVGSNAPADYLDGIQSRIDRIRAQFDFAESARRRQPPPSPAGAGEKASPPPQLQLVLGL